MATYEELLDRIAKLEKENAELKRPRTSRRSQLPENACSIFPHLDGDFATKLGWIVRTACFPPSKEKVNRRIASGRVVAREQAIRLAEMNDAQYECYLSAMTQILMTLNEHRTCCIADKADDLLKEDKER